MKHGFLSSGLPRWVIEEGKEDSEQWSRVYDVSNYEFSESDPQFKRDDFLRAQCYPEGEMQCFCQRCCVEITGGEYCADCAHLLGLEALSDNSELARHHLQHLDLMERQRVGEATHDGDTPGFSEEGGESKDSQNSQRDRIGRRKRADGCVPGRFPILKDPKSFHEAHGHPSDEVTRMLCMTYYGNANAVKGYADSCPYCLSRRRRIQPRLRIETVDRAKYRMGGRWTMDFTAMCLRNSHDLNQVGCAIL